MINDRRFILALLAVAVCSIAVMPFLQGADDPKLLRNRQRIDAMTQAERERLVRNYERYTQLPEAERDYFRTLHAELAADRIGRASATMDTYAEWLQTIPPYDRDALQKEHDPAKKISLIRDVLDEHREDQLESRLGQRIDDRLEQLPRFGTIPILTRRDLDSVIAMINSDQALALDAGDAIEGDDGLRKTLKLFELLGQRNRQMTALLTDRRMQSLLDAIADKQTRESLLTDAQGRPVPRKGRQTKIALMLWKNLELAYDRDTRRRSVTQEQLEGYLAQLPPAEQEPLLELSAAEFRLNLRRNYLEANTAGRIDMRNVRQFLLPSRVRQVPEPNRRRSPTDALRPRQRNADSPTP